MFIYRPEPDADVKLLATWSNSGPASTYPLTKMDQLRLLIADGWVATEKALPVLSPYDESVICEIPLATQPVIDAAVAAAKAGAADMRRLTAHMRSAILARAAVLLSTGTFL